MEQLLNKCPNCDTCLFVKQLRKNQSTILILWSSVSFLLGMVVMFGIIAYISLHVPKPKVQNQYVPKAQEYYL